MEIFLQNYTNQDFDTLRQVLKQFKDIDLSIENNDIKVFVSKLDFHRLKEISNQRQIKILQELVDKIDKNHSYTIAGNKRMYDYKGDRKVKDKQDKVKTRLGYT